MPTTKDRKVVPKPQVVRSQVEPRLVERRRRVLEERRRRTRRRVMAGVCVLALIGVVVGSLASPLTDVDRIRVTGMERATDEALRSASGIRIGDQMVTADLALARDELRALPMVAGARVVREWPSTVHIDVVEEVPVVLVRSGEVERVVSRSGRVLPDGLGDLGDLPLLEVSGVELIEGESLAEGMRAAVGVFTRIPDELRTTLGSASVDESGNLIFHLDDDADVLFGPVEDVPAKLAATHAFLTRVIQDCLDVVDVRQPDLVTASRRSGCATPAPTEVVKSSGSTRPAASGDDAADDAADGAGNGEDR